MGERGNYIHFSDDPQIRRQNEGTVKNEPAFFHSPFLFVSKESIMFPETRAYRGEQTDA